MKRTFLSALVLGLVFLLPSLALAVTDSGAEASPAVGNVSNTDATGDAELTTLFATNNNYAGNSFDIQCTQQMVICGFDVNLAANSPSYTVDVYTRPGTALGYETSAAGWTLLGSEVVTPAGVNLPTHVDIGGLMMDAGDTVGFIITAQEAVSGTGGFSYTNGGPNTYSDAYISIVTFCGLPSGFPPASTFQYRAWNGTVHYLYGNDLDRTTWGSIKVGY
ncbi:MAG: hypothetical protein KAR40_13295 [Candidatus Sabulitectum sp.]|nr:hypothetical protein [Candidatus Sabulitectum sp.]